MCARTTCVCCLVAVFGRVHVASGGAPESPQHLRVERGFGDHLLQFLYSNPIPEDWPNRDSDQSHSELLDREAKGWSQSLTEVMLSFVLAVISLELGSPNCCVGIKGHPLALWCVLKR